MAVENIVALASSIFSSLPQILEMAQLIVYVFLVFFFGGIVVKGIGIRLNFFLKTLFVMVTGAVCLAASKSIAGYLPFFSEGMFKLFQVDVFIGGVITAFLLSISLYLLTSGMRKDELKELKGQLAKLRSLLISNHTIRPVGQHQAEKVAEKTTGFKAVSAEIAGDEWRVVVKEGEKERIVIMDALTAEVKNIFHKSKIGTFFSKKARIAGLVILVAMFAFILLNFRGLPTISDTLSEIGISPEALSGFSDLLQQQQGLLGQSSCREAIPILQDQQALSQAQVYSDESTKSVFEEQSGSKVSVMRRVEKGGMELILGFTENKKVCFTSNGEFCGCFDAGS